MQGSNKVVAHTPAISNDANATLPSIRLGALSVEPYPDMRHLLAAVFRPDGSVRAGSGIAINTEKVMASLNDPELVDSTRAATVRFADGAGVVWALRRRGFRVPRLTGVEFWNALMAESAERSARVFLLGGAPGVVDEVAERLRTQYPQIRICGTRHGYMSGEEKKELEAQIVRTRPDVVTVAMGSPLQERLILKLRISHPEAFYLGVGGTYDVYTGRVKRAPRFFQQHGLEWLYRLMRQPARARRQTALLRFVSLEMRGLL